MEERSSQDPDDQSRVLHNLEGARRLSEKLKALWKAIDICLEHNLWEPALILIYSGIDAMAWLDRPRDRDDVTPDDFINWVNKYLLPESALECTAEDMYGARCGLLHSHTAESKRHRQLRVKKLFYSRMWEGKPLILLQLRMNEKFFPATVNMELLARAFLKAIERFTAAVDGDPMKLALVSDRIVESYLVEVRPL